MSNVSTALILQSRFDIFHNEDCIIVEVVETELVRAPRSRHLQSIRFYRPAFDELIEYRFDVFYVDPYNRTAEQRVVISKDIVYACSEPG